MSPQTSSATAGSAPAPRSATPAPRGFETTHPASPTPFLPLSGLFPDDCSAQKDAPAPQTLHYYHSRSSKNPRGPRSKGARRGSSPVASLTTDTAPPAASLHHDSIPSPAHHIREGGRAR